MAIPVAIAPPVPFTSVLGDWRWESGGDWADIADAVGVVAEAEGMAWSLPLALIDLTTRG